MAPTKEKLAKVAGYRNHVVHFYDKITPKELYVMSNNDLSDIEHFGKRIAEPVKHPEKFDLSVG